MTGFPIFIASGTGFVRVIAPAADFFKKHCGGDRFSGTHPASGRFFKNSSRLRQVFFREHWKSARIWYNFSVYKWNTLRLNESDDLEPILLVQCRPSSKIWNIFFENHRGSGSFSAVIDISALKVWVLDTKFYCASSWANLRPKQVLGGISPRTTQIQY